MIMVVINPHLSSAKFTMLRGAVFTALFILCWGTACKPRNPYLVLKQAEDEYKRGDYEKAKDLYHDALKLKADLPEAYYGLGMVAYKQSRIDDAITYFRKTREIEPKYVKAYYQEAVIYQLIGQDKLTEAVPLYRQALDIQPDMFEARMNLGRVLTKLGRYQEALDLYLDGLQYHPDNTELTEAIARLRNTLQAQSSQPLGKASDDNGSTATNEHRE